jgi:hypothetical protein
VLWIFVLPRFGGYAIRQVVDKLDDGAQTLRVVKIPNAELEEWDRTRDEQGELRSTSEEEKKSD